MPEQQDLHIENLPLPDVQLIDPGQGFRFAPIMRIDPFIMDFGNNLVQNGQNANERRNDLVQHLEQEREMLERLIRVDDEPFNLDPVVPEVRGDEVVAEQGRHIPRRLAQREPPVVGRKLAHPALKKPTFKKKVNYVKEGVQYKGYRFSRELTPTEENALSLLGYHSTIRMFPDLLWKVPENLIDESEECVILVSELADYVATQECTNTITNFDIKTNSKEYQISYKKWLQTINKFKRSSKNG